MTHGDPSRETEYDFKRVEQWLAGEARWDGLASAETVARRAGMTRRSMLRAFGTAGAAGLPLAALIGGRPAPARAAAKTGTATATASGGPIVKPLPDDQFYVYGSNAEMRWEVMRDKGYLTPAANFFVRDHTSTPLIDASTWELRLFGTGLKDQPTSANPVTFTLDDLRKLPSQSVVAFVECTGNGRGFFTSQQGQTVAGTAWKLGAVGVAAWTGVPLSTVLERAGITRDAVDVMPYGLDPDYVDAASGTDYGKVRRPMPVAKALDDVILAYDLNGQPLPPDNGYPVRVIAPGWIGITNIKWVGQIEVSATPLTSYWNTQSYRLFGPSYPEAGAPISTQVTKSAFELEWGAQLPANQPYLLTGRSWSGNGAIARTDISTDGGNTWHRAKVRNPGSPAGWQLWEFPWVTPAPGSYALRARATDVTGKTQPVTAVYNTNGYLFDAIVQHPVTTV